MASADRIIHSMLVRPALRFYLRKDRRARYDGFQLQVYKGVFHPLFFFSTKIMYRFLNGQEMQGKKFLEIGSGSGLLSLLARRKGALVTSIDINLEAVENTQSNFIRNFGENHGASILQSDLFEGLSEDTFDLIAINPPYYFKTVRHPRQHAWYCGADGEYFQRLFAGLPKHLGRGGRGYMILEEGCEIERIAGLAAAANVRMEEVASEKARWETSHIFLLTASSQS